MKVTGFTFIKNAIKYDYPVVEAIKSILPICTNFVVAVGKSEDQTLELIQSIDPDKIRIIETTWDSTKREGGEVLAMETDKALGAVQEDSDWAFYIQGDEVVHEKYLDKIKAAMIEHIDNPGVDGLLFDYKHFYGSYDYIGSSDHWYPHEIRVIKNDKSIYSYKDAQGFRKGDNEKLRVKQIDACMYHYGWVKDPRAMQKKQEDFNKLWHDDEWISKNVVDADSYDYREGVRALYKFQETHPEVMKERVERINWKFDYDISFNKRSLKYRFKEFMRNVFSLDFSHNNYIKV